jgi:hypothetical protein
LYILEQNLNSLVYSKKTFKHKLINRFNNNPNEEIHNSKEFRESSIYQHCRKISEEHFRVLWYTTLQNLAILKLFFEMAT